MEVKVTEITEEQINSPEPKEVDLGDGEKSKLFNSLRRGIRSRTHQRVFKLVWEGSKIPRGATILGKEIGWTQHGIVLGTDGSHIGQYDRTVESEGESHEKQEMIVYVSDSNSQE